MNNDDFLCVGGSRDASVVKVPSDMRVFEFPVRNDSPIEPIDDTTAITLHRVAKTDLYRVERFYIRSREFRILVHESMAVEDAFNQLLDCYAASRNTVSKQESDERADKAALSGLRVAAMLTTAKVSQLLASHDN